MRYLERLDLAILFAFAPLGCFLSPGECNYEHRSIEFAGTLTPAPAGPGGTPVGATLMLNETRGADPDFRTLHLEFTGTLSGTMEAVEVRDIQTDMVLATFAGGTGWSANVDLGPTPTQEELAELAGTNRLQLRLISTPATLPVLEALLAVTARTNWSHPRCD